MTGQRSRQLDANLRCKVHSWLLSRFAHKGGAGVILFSHGNSEASAVMIIINIIESMEIEEMSQEAGASPALTA